MARVTFDGTYTDWRRVARELLNTQVAPAAVEWCDQRASQPLLAGVSLAGPQSSHSPPETATSRFTVPRAFVAGAKYAACHRDESRWTLLYRLLWRLTQGERDLLESPLDTDARRFQQLVAEVRRDEHKMHAFVRFREVSGSDGHSHYVAWHRPDHFIVRLAAPFFRERFETMQWSILTPDECAHWDGKELRFTAGVDASQAPSEDRLEDLWRTYYASVFNPARVNPKAMTRELPVRHWSTLPETRIIPDLIAGAAARVDGMLANSSAGRSARAFVPPGDTSLTVLRDAARGCQGCGLHQAATQTVFGQGAETARIMLVGEQPGDEEDLKGVPFVGPAGKVLDEVLVSAGLTRSEVYITNAVKHFTFRREGKRRIHERPRVTDVRACRPWLEAEVHRVNPEAIVCLGSTAAQALVGPQVRVQRDRGRLQSSHWAKFLLVTYHPSAVLRAEDPAHSQEIFDWLVADLRQAAGLVTSAA